MTRIQNIEANIPSNKRQINTEVLEHETPLTALRRVCDLSDETIHEAAAKGALWVSLQRGRGRTRPRQLRDAHTELSAGSSVMLNYNASVLASVPQAMHCVSDQVNYGVWYKPAGMLCQGSKWSDHTVATQVVAGMRGKPCYLVHRLDRAASGLLIVAYTSNALRALTRLFEQQCINKTYQATVHGEFKHDLPRHIDTLIDGRSASTTIVAMQNDKEQDTCILRLTIATGRKHQIRKHLAELGHPIVGDRRYGTVGEHDMPGVALQLIACELSFTCPFSARPIALAIDP